MPTIESSRNACWDHAKLLRNQGRYDAACRHLFSAYASPDDASVAYEVALFAKQSHRAADARNYLATVFDKGISTPRLLALMGSLCHVLGDFAGARERLLAAWHAGVNLDEWQVLPALAHLQRYSNRNHPDRALLEAALADQRWTARTRSALEFARGKLFDDTGAYGDAVTAWEHAHRWSLLTTGWDHRRWIQRVDRARQPIDSGLGEQVRPWAPVLVVGLPRSGTTLLADRLAFHPALRNRGEMPFLLHVHDLLAAQPRTPELLTAASELWHAHLRQDDQPGAAGYIDNNPFNLLALETAFSLDPETRVLWCRRAPADNALSQWSQSFAHSDYAYAHRFEDIARVQADVAVLHGTMVRRWPSRILTIEYEDFVLSPDCTLERAWHFLGLQPPRQADGDVHRRGPITSASLWQVRQPIHAGSVGHSRHYVEWLPQLATWQAS